MPPSPSLVYFLALTVAVGSYAAELQQDVATAPDDVAWSDVAKLKSAITLLADTAMQHFLEGLHPSVWRARRSLGPSEVAEDNFYLDTIVEWLGAVMDRQKVVGNKCN
jgi:hypothetical protein